MCARVQMLTNAQSPACRLHTRYTVRVANWRYTEWVKFSNTTGVADWLTVVGRELYPETLGVTCRFDTDSVNVAADPANADTARKLAAILRSVV